MLPRLRPHAANALTALRVALAPVFVAAICSADATSISRFLPAALFAVAAASDVWDGRVARRCGSESAGGRTFDHFADIVFVLAALSAYAWLGIAPWWVPAAIGASFAFYVADSWWRADATSPGLIGSRIGHAAGVLNYSLIGVLVFNDTAAIQLLPPQVLAKLFWLVPAYSAVAVAARLAGRSQQMALARAAGPK